MAGADLGGEGAVGGRRRRIGLVLLVGLLYGLSLACASGRTKGPEPPASSAVADLPSRAVPPPSPVPPDPSPDEPEEKELEDRNTIVIEEGGEESREQNLAEVARRERARRLNAPAPIAVVTDKNLDSHATGKLTYTREEESPALSHEEEDESLQDEESYWRNRVREDRREWAESVETIQELERTVSELRTRFYAEDDPYVRDARIKPQWDRALDRLSEERQRAERLEEELDETLEEGRRAGALPGWLREGSELEPETRPYGETRKKEEPQIVGEPVIVEEGGPDG